MTRAFRGRRGISTRWCATHQARYPAWLDANKTRLARCPECEEEDRRYIAAVKRRAEVAADAKATERQEP
jgi:hypothetical protein